MKRVGVTALGLKSFVTKTQSLGEHPGTIMPQLIPDLRDNPKIQEIVLGLSHAFCPPLQLRCHYSLSTANSLSTASLAKPTGTLVRATGL
jgi:hypothetical protein